MKSGKEHNVKRKQEIVCLDLMKKGRDRGKYGKNRKIERIYQPGTAP